MNTMGLWLSRVLATVCVVSTLCTLYCVATDPTAGFALLAIIVSLTSAVTSFAFDKQFTDFKTRSKSL